jgi:hypothetical protein
VVPLWCRIASDAVTVCDDDDWYMIRCCCVNFGVDKCCIRSIRWILVEVVLDSRLCCVMI